MSSLIFNFILSSLLPLFSLIREPSTPLPSSSPDISTSKKKECSSGSFFVWERNDIFLVILCSYSPSCADCYEENPAPASGKPVVISVTHSSSFSSGPSTARLSSLGNERGRDKPSGEALLGVSPSATLTLALESAEGHRSPMTSGNRAASSSVSDRR